MITGGDLRQSRLDVGYKTFTISPWVLQPTPEYKYTDNQSVDASLGLNAQRSPHFFGLK